MLHVPQSRRYDRHTTNHPIFVFKYITRNNKNVMINTHDRFESNIWSFVIMVIEPDRNKQNNQKKKIVLKSNGTDIVNSK